MSCPSAASIAAIASGRDPGAHVEACATCRDALDEQRAIRALLAAAPPPASPSRPRIERLAAEVMAAADRAPARPRRSARLAIASVAIAAAAAALLLSRRPIDPGSRPPTLSVELSTPSDPVPVPVPVPVPDPVAPPATASAAISGLHARFARRTHHGRDVVTLRDGAITVDARHRRPVEIASGGTRVRIGDAKVAIRARNGVIAMVTVIAGTAEIARDGHRELIEAGFVWEPAAPPAAASEDVLGPFSAGWTALRAGRLADAIAAFDRATDPAVAEDAVYWAAVATERAGQPDDARRRFADFLARFPASPRADAARSALARLAAP